MGKRVRLTSDRVNNYGYRVLTEGIDISQFERNPVMLYMHERGNVIGYFKDIKKEKDRITAEPVFDEATELSRTVKKQFEVGSLRMVSIGFTVTETSDDPTLKLAGQTGGTVTKSKLGEVSIVDIGANDDALALRSLASGMSVRHDEILYVEDEPNTEDEEMDLELLKRELGLPDSADEDAVLIRITELLAAEKAADEMTEELLRLRTAQIEAVVDGAIAENKLTAGKREDFVKLGMRVGVDDLKLFVSGMNPTAKLSTRITRTADETRPTEYKKLSDVPSDQLSTLREENKDLYKRLFKAEYGYECDIDE
jgi:hypothetical protein